MDARLQLLREEQPTILSRNANEGHILFKTTLHKKTYLCQTRINTGDDRILRQGMIDYRVCRIFNVI